ncbi:MAG TPA: sensor histidine kinase [Microbacterium sp.]|uniref:sensor histidine kinase n=1 Tax=Microbacterium sp. TaxID=51671 RepID=UPI000EBE5158|nr:sensor histidine kinase [Microbacterium sp.]
MAAADALRAPRAMDLVIAVICGAGGIGLLLLLQGLDADVTGVVVAVPVTGTSAWWLVVATILVQCVCVAWARHAPKTTLLFVAVAAFLLALTIPGAVLEVTALAIVVVVFLAFLSAPSHGLWWTFATAAVLSLVGSFVNAMTIEGVEPLLAVGESFVQIGGQFGFPLLLATVLRARRESRDAHRRELRALTRERDALVDATVAHERTAMARELHDIAAHHMSGIALMASAVERQVTTDPDAARAAASAIRAESTAVLQNLRRVVGLLREDGAGQRSVENFASVADLVETAAGSRTAEVRLSILRSDEDQTLGERVGPLAQLAAYRTIQEALANASMHAPGAACVVEIDDTRVADVRVLVRNAPATSTPSASSNGGFGLVGMRERAELIGAELSYGRTPQGGWEVQLIIPREGTS